MEAKRRNILEKRHELLLRWLRVEVQRLVKSEEIVLIWVICYEICMKIEVVRGS